MRSSSKVYNIIMSLCEIVIGVLLLINPVGFTTGIISFLGFVLAVVGIAGIVQYFRTPAVEAVTSQGLTRGILMTLAGLFCILKGEWFILTFPILTVVYGIGTLVVGVTKVQWTVSLIRIKAKKWFIPAISALLTIICAVIILCNPFSTVAFLWTFIAISLLVEAVVDLVSALLAKKD